MHYFTFLSVLLSFGAFAAGMTADLPEFVSNTSIDYWNGKQTDEMMDMLREHFVRTDGMEIEPLDVFCGMYSRLVTIDGSFRSNPPSLHDLIFDEATSKSFHGKLDELHDKCKQNHLGHQGEECWFAYEGIIIMHPAIFTYEMIVFHAQHFLLVQDTVVDVLTKPDMCGEGWKHGQKYIEMRNRRGAPVTQRAI